MVAQIRDLLADLKENDAIKEVGSLLAGGADPFNIVKECQKGMEIVGQRYEKCEYYLSELIMAAEIFKSIMKMVRPRISADVKEDSRGKIVMGTCKGDIHDIGKNIIVPFLEAAGFEVYDVGVDVAPEMFLAKLKETNSTILGMSSLLTTSIMSMKNTVEVLEKNGIRDKVKIIVGGGPVTEKTREMVGADFYGKDVKEAVQICSKLAEGR